MKTFHPRLSLLAGFLLTVAGSAVAANHHHADHMQQPAKLELDHGGKWQTDAPLRKGMDALRTAYAARLTAVHAGTLSAEDYRALGAKVEVATFVAECKLEAKADAVLHVVIAELLAAADVLQGKASGMPADGAHRAIVALNSYGRYFDHPEWKPLQRVVRAVPPRAAAARHWLPGDRRLADATDHAPLRIAPPSVTTMLIGMSWGCG